MRKLSLCLFALVAVSVPAVQAHHYGHVGAFVAPVYQPVVAHQYVAPVVQQVEVVTKPVVAPVAVTLPYVAPVVAVQAVPYVAPVVSHGYSGAFVRRSQVVVQRPVVVRVRTFRRR